LDDGANECILFFNCSVSDAIIMWKKTEVSNEIAVYINRFMQTFSSKYWWWTGYCARVCTWDDYLVCSS